MLAIFFCGMIRGWGGFRNRDDNRRLESRSWSFFVHLSGDVYAANKASGQPEI
jgi:hypothetical protein